MNLNTEVVRVSLQAPERDVIVRVGEIIRAGGLVAFPTETVYGLGANALDAAAVARIFEAKGRPATNPLIVHVNSIVAAQALVTDWPRSADLLSRRFWPGPLTLVLPKQPVVPDLVTAGLPSVGIRVPANPIAQALIEAAGVPIAAPSANRSTSLSPTRAEHVVRDLNGRVDMIVDGGATSGGLESTVLDLTASPPRLLRPGLVAPLDIEAVIGPIVRKPPSIAMSSTPLPSPGLMLRHYAPRAPLEGIDKDARARVAELCQQGRCIGWLAFAEELRDAVMTQEKLVAIEMPADPTEYAARLYAALHALDDAGVERIVVSLPPDSEGWLAIRDRLRRAAAK